MADKSEESEAIAEAAQQSSQQCPPEEGKNFGLFLAFSRYEITGMMPQRRQAARLGLRGLSSGPRGPDAANRNKTPPHRPKSKLC